MMRCDCADDADNASSADDAHFWSDAFVASCIDDEHVVSLPDAVVNDLSGNERHAFKHFCLHLLGMRCVNLGECKFMTHDIELLLQGNVPTHKSRILCRHSQV